MKITNQTAFYASIILDSETRILPCTHPAKTGRRTASAFARYRWSLDFWLLDRLLRALSRDELVNHSVVVIIRADLYRHSLPLACRIVRFGSRARPRHICDAFAGVVVFPMFRFVYHSSLRLETMVIRTMRLHWLDDGFHERAVGIDPEMCDR
jgi:hypothetical protein